ncbi:hypothetical protein CXF97_17995 [Pseudomonas sp. Choline-02u-1]|nr:hypothetical protein CXF97_17995 [Pseudomonas sp. Choline-02u-1]
MTPLIQCGSGLARECGGSDEEMLADTPLSRASPLPQGRCFRHKKGDAHGVPFFIAAAPIRTPATPRLCTSR